MKNVLVNVLKAPFRAIGGLFTSGDDKIDEIKVEGTTVLLVEQNANAALKHSDRGYVLETGSIVVSGSAAELAGNDDVRKAYLGI